MHALAWGVVGAALLAAVPIPRPAAGGRFILVGRRVGEGGATPPFWREYERVSAAGDRARYGALKRSHDAYDRALAIYLAPRFDDMAFVEAALGDTRFVEHAEDCSLS